MVHMINAIELGLDTFGDVTVDADGQPLPHAQVLRDVVDQAVLADQVGLDFIGVGEHHRTGLRDFGAGGRARGDRGDARRRFISGRR